MRVFRNNNGEIRSGWKIGITYLAFNIMASVASCIFGILYGVYLISKNSYFLYNATSIDEQLSSMTHLPGVCLFLIQCLVMIFTVILFSRIWSKWKLRDIGLTNIKSSWKDLCIGLLTGAISFTIVAAMLLAAKSVKLVNDFTEPRFSSGLLIQLIIFIFVGINEELFTRGYCMTILKQTKISWVPMVGSAIIFSLMHSLNQGISLLAYINLFLFGISMAYVFIKTKSIWMGIGYHITWNYFQGNVFGFLVSGNATDSIYSVKEVSNNIINGGSFGPEGGLVVTILLLLTIFIIYKFLPNRNID